MSHFVLVHGAWHGAWCWQHLIPALQARGHRVSAPDLPGHGADTTPSAQVTLESYSQRIVDTIQAAGEPVQLVGHSMGGMVIGAAAETAPERVAGLIFLCAFVPLEGLSLNQLAARYNGQSPLGQVIRPGAEEGTLVVVEEALRDVFYADCPEADVELARSRLVPQPASPMMTPLVTSAQRYGALPKSYIECLQDQAIPVAAQRAMIRDAGITRVETLDTSHSPFLSAPAALADALERLA